MPSYQTPPFLNKSTIPAWEQSPFVLNGELYRSGFVRGWTSTTGAGVAFDKYDSVHDVFYRVGFIPWNRYLGCAFVDAGRLYIFGVTDVSTSPNKIVRQEIDIATWQLTGPEIDIRGSSGGYKFYNTSVCAGPNGYIMAYETNEATPFSLRFLQSTDLVTWSPIGDLCHANFYSACPTVKYAENGYYVVAYMFDYSGTGAGPWITAMARTNDFINIQSFGGNANLTSYQQLIAPDGEMDGINASDVDFVEWDGKVYFTYMTGDQRTWAGNNDAWYEGTFLDFYHEYWP